MSATYRIGSILLLMVIACLIGSTFAGRQAEKAEKAAVQKWEHKAFSGLTDDANHAWGDEGWELVAVTAPSERGPRWFYFKRPKP